MLGSSWQECGTRYSREIRYIEAATMLVIIQNISFKSFAPPSRKLSKCCRSYDVSSGSFHDQFFVEVSELNGNIWIIVDSVCKLFVSCLCAFNIRNGCRRFMNFQRRFLVDELYGLGQLFGL